jgi:tetratricopeptide (TPR) repeat protein
MQQAPEALIRTFLASWFLLAAIFAYGEFPLAAPHRYPSECDYSQLRPMVADRNFLSASALIDRWLESVHDDQARSFLLVEKAKLLYADQQHIEAQEAFLEALKLYPLMDEPAARQDEQQFFLSLVPEYELSIQSKEGSERFSRQIEGLVAEHPSYTSLEYYAAASLANCGKMIEFFDGFFHAFGHRTECFLRWKTVGVLHLRLHEASSSEARREYHRAEAVRWLKEAYSRQKGDSALPVKILFVLRPSERGAFLREVVTSLEVPMRRADCFALIAQAIELREVDVAKQLIEKARTWYQYSRALDELSGHL